MRVSSRYAALVTAVAGAMVTAASSAAGQHAPTPPSPPPPSHNPCCGHPGGPTIHPPTVHIGGPSVHVGGPNIHVGGINLHSSVNVNVSASASANAIATATGGASASGDTFVYAGGGYVGGSYPGAATALAGLRLAGASYELVEEERTRLIEEWRVVRAVCVDDTGTPHPASRPDPEERVHPDFDGELFRCVAGTALQATLGWREDGHDRFDGGETIQCEKGEALRHGAGGRLYCATEQARRNCNERSLLRLHGPGVKLIYLRREEIYGETYERRDERSEVSSMTLMLDGGVGGYR
ncbi:MAG: hypothetical protein ACLFQ5_03995 [Oceanicaulis sp.]